MGIELKAILEKHNFDIDGFRDGRADITPRLYDDLFVYYVEEMPYGTAKARDGDPYEWIEYALLDDLR